MATTTTAGPGASVANVTVMHSSAVSGRLPTCKSPPCRLGSLHVTARTAGVVNAVHHATPGSQATPIRLASSSDTQHRVANPQHASSRPKQSQPTHASSSSDSHSCNSSSSSATRAGVRGEAEAGQSFASLAVAQQPEQACSSAATGLHSHGTDGLLPTLSRHAKQHDALRLKGALTRLLAKESLAASRQRATSTEQAATLPSTPAESGHSAPSSSMQKPGPPAAQQQQQRQQRPSTAPSSSEARNHGRRSVVPQSPPAGTSHRRDSRGHPAASRPQANRSAAAGRFVLPPGPEWARLQRHFRGPPGNHALPRLDSIVLVEGLTDCSAVQRAADVAVYAVGGSGIMTKQASEQLKLLPTLGRELIILTDPDREGNVLRDHLDTVLGSAVKHAFVPSQMARSTAGDSRHEAGNVGVEHASPGAIRAALAAARPSQGTGRTEFSVEQLMQLGLVNSFDSREVVGAKLQRAMLCSALGVGQACGAALVKLLNRYFTREQFEAALAAAKQQST